MAMDMRAKKAGIALDIQMKLEKRYDEEEKLGVPGRVVTWINEALNGEIKKNTSTAWRDVVWWLRDGTVICQLMNKILVAAGKPTFKFKKNAATHFVALENIENFNKAAGAYGVPETDLFQSVDLYEGHKGPFLNVINCLNRLGTVANKNGFQPQYEETPTQLLNPDLYGELD